MNVRPLSDSALLNEYLSGNKDAISQLIELHRKKVFDYVMMMVKDGDIADDIVQETFIKVVRFIDERRYTDNGRFLSWVMRIAHNQVIDYFRQNKHENKITESDAGFDLLGTVKFSSKTVEDDIVADQIKDDVRRLIEHLPDEQKEVIKMRYYEDLSFKEIAEQTGVSINTALGRMRYALINLRKMIKENQLVLC
ncbi:MAG: sigma-70 family RNA polymerase sigma factor [Rikenellaceae bacterium]|nr:sigma-70 family RNA polymerase sigma factor [Rikenellaceae bacterium]